jgi:hypothetical protein
VVIVTYETLVPGRKENQPTSGVVVSNAKARPKGQRAQAGPRPAWPAIPTERMGGEANLGLHADAPTLPILAQHGLAVDLRGGRQALPELPAMPGSHVAYPISNYKLIILNF